MKCISEYKMLSVNKNNIGLFYHKGNIYYKSIKTNEKYSLIGKVTSSFKSKIFVRFRLLERMFRLEPRLAISLDDFNFLLSYAGFVYRVNIAEKSITPELKYRRRMMNPLSFARLNNGNILFGEYFSNNDHEEVSIYERGNEGWKCVYSFPRDTIYHIHCIVVNNEDIYILTGDKDRESCIWHTDNHFLDIKKIVGGEQKYRSCVAFPYKNGLIYATDTPLERNFLFYIHKENDWVLEKLFEMPGPCIYGVSKKDRLYFATSVEPDARYEDTFRYYFTYKLGQGVKDRFVHMIRFDNENSITEIAKFKKDIWPMLLMQFGNCGFVNNESDELFVTPISVKKYDSKTLLIEE